MVENNSILWRSMNSEFTEASDTINTFFTFSIRISEYLPQNIAFAIAWQEKNYKIFPGWKTF